jgi:hypothetical protein
VKEKMKILPGNPDENQKSGFSIRNLKEKTVMGKQIYTDLKHS